MAAAEGVAKVVTLAQRLAAAASKAAPAPSNEADADASADAAAAVLAPLGQLVGHVLCTLCKPGMDGVLRMPVARHALGVLVAQLLSPGSKVGWVAGGRVVGRAGAAVNLVAEGNPYPSLLSPMHLAASQVDMCTRRGQQGPACPWPCFCSRLLLQSAHFDR